VIIVGREAIQINCLLDCYLGQNISDYNFCSFKTQIPHLEHAMCLTECTVRFKNITVQQVRKFMMVDMIIKYERLINACLEKIRMHFDSVKTQ
jgi:hypothetical protein